MSPLVEASFRRWQEKGIDLVPEERDLSVVIPISQLGCARELDNYVSDSTSNVDLDASNMEIMDTDDSVVPPNPAMHTAGKSVCIVVSMAGSFGPAELREVCVTYGKVRRMYSFRTRASNGFISFVEFEEPEATRRIHGALDGKSLRGDTCFVYVNTKVDFDKSIGQAEVFFDLSQPGSQGLQELAQFRWRDLEK